MPSMFLIHKKKQKILIIFLPIESIWPNIKLNVNETFEYLIFNENQTKKKKKVGIGEVDWYRLQEIKLILNLSFC